MCIDRSGRSQFEDIRQQHSVNEDFTQLQPVVVPNLPPIAVTLENQLKFCASQLFSDVIPDPKRREFRHAIATDIMSTKHENLRGSNR